MAEIISSVPRVFDFITHGFLAIDITMAQATVRGEIGWQIQLYNELMADILNTPPQSVNPLKDDLENK
ncbi:hypothetical protein [Pseudomonas sp. BR20]|uniref:hypothetical protein n=1 Tax=Pseudomonas sp. BR20 TaxID=3137452 RepID=UPI003D6FE5BE